MKVFYYIITKISRVDGEIIRTDIGYIESIEEKGLFRTYYGYSFEDWVQENSSDLESGNILVNSYFESNSISYVSVVKKNYIPDGLPLITDLLNLE